MNATKELREWMSSMLGYKVSQEESLAHVLKSGIVLCNLMNKIQPGVVSSINSNDSSVAFKQNIGSFLRSCQSIGLEECRLFDISDLYDERNIDKVISTLSLLQSIYARRKTSDVDLPIISTPPILRRINSGKATPDLPFGDVIGQSSSLFLSKIEIVREAELLEGKKEKKKKGKLGMFLRRSSTSLRSSSTSPPGSPKDSRDSPQGSPPSFSSSPAPITSVPLHRSAPSLALDSYPSAEVTKLRDGLERLYEDRKILKERVGFAYPEKYRSFVMFEDFLKKDDELVLRAPPGMSEVDFLKAEESKILGDIFTLSSMLAIVEENRGLRIRMAELQKMVDAMVAEKKQVTSRVDELLVPSATSLREAEADGIMFSDWKGKVGEIKGGTAEKLVEHLYTTSVAGSVSEYLDFFLLTYRSFITPTKVLEMLTQTFLANRTPTEGEEGTEAAAVQVQQDKLKRLRICNFLKRWVESYYEDFDSDLLAAFQGFMDACQEDRLVVLLKKTLDKKLAGGSSAQRQFTFDCSPPVPSLPRGMHLSFTQEDWEPIEIARQLTIIEYEMYRDIAPKELLSLSWQKSDRDKRSPNLLKMIHRFNEVNNWVQWQIVSESTIKKRAGNIKKMIRVMEELKKLNNFNAIFVFVSALHSASVNRLRKTWEEVPKSSVKILEEFDTLTSPNGSFSAYREELHNANPPCIPYVGVYLSDLTFIEEGNPDNLENGFINFFKRRMIAEVIKEIQQYQQAPYNLLQVAQLQQYLTNHKILSDNDLFQRSLVSEPRDTHSMHMSSSVH